MGKFFKQKISLLEIYPTEIFIQRKEELNATCPPHPWVLHPEIQPTTVGKQLPRSAVWNLQMQREVCVHLMGLEHPGYCESVMGQEEMIQFSEKEKKTKTIKNLSCQKLKHYYASAGRHSQINGVNESK